MAQLHRRQRRQASSATGRSAFAPSPHICEPNGIPRPVKCQISTTHAPPRYPGRSIPIPIPYFGGDIERWALFMGGHTTHTHTPCTTHPVSRMHIPYPHLRRARTEYRTANWLPAGVGCWLLASGQCAVRGQPAGAGAPGPGLPRA
jgi:hypothetical protein